MKKNQGCSKKHERQKLFYDFWAPPPPPPPPQQNGGRKMFSVKNEGGKFVPNCLIWRENLSTVFCMGSKTKTFAKLNVFSRVLGLVQS